MSNKPLRHGFSHDDDRHHQNHCCAGHQCYRLQIRVSRDDHYRKQLPVLFVPDKNTMRMYARSSLIYRYQEAKITMEKANAARVGFQAAGAGS